MTVENIMPIDAASPTPRFRRRTPLPRPAPPDSSTAQGDGGQPFEVLLVDDDEDLFDAVAGLYEGDPQPALRLRWASNFAAARDLLASTVFDAVLLDYRLGTANGLDLIGEARRMGCDAPFIVLTGFRQRRIEMEAMQAGAADYLIKGKFDGEALERTIRFAVRKTRVELELRARIEQQLAVAELGQRALAGGSIASLCEEAARLVVRTLAVPFCSVLERVPGSDDLFARASIGWSDSKGDARLGPEEAPEAHFTLRSGVPVIIEDVSRETRFPVGGELVAQGIASGIGVALSEGDHPSGVLAAYSRTPSSFTLDDVHFLQSMANVLASAVGRSRVEAALRERERLLGAVFDNALEGIFIIGQDGRFIDVNPAGRELLEGGGRGPLATRSVAELSTREGQLPLHELLRAAGEPARLRGEASFRGREGEPRIVEYTAVANILPGRHLSVAHDVTERRRVEEALRRSEASYRELIERLPDGIVVFEGKRFIYANPSFLSMLGLERLDELAGHDLLASLLPELHGAPVEERHLLEVASRPRSVEARVQRRDGRRIIMEAFLLRTRFDGEPVFLAVTRDVTERSEMQARLLLSDRMASVGTLAAGVAHEINNPLAYVMANLSYIAEEVVRLGEQVSPPQLDEVTKALTEAREGAERVRDIVRDLKTFSRSDEDRREPLDVRRVIESSINMAWNEIRHRAQLVRDYRDAPPVMANVSRLGQVFLNLLVNAAQSITEGRVSQNEIRVVVREDGGEVVVEVADTGCGIAPDLLGHIFDPFFTTKEVGVGTGLGLSICHSIVTSLGGRIAVESVEGRGTHFKVTLPAAPGFGDREAIPGASTGEIARGRVLVVDDEAAIGRAVRRALEPTHEVVPVTRAREALERLRSGERFDVILCDVMMPEMTGADLYSELLRFAPADAKKVIFLTGGAFTPGARRFLDEVANPRLEKPFDLDQLRRLLATLLG